MTKRLAVLFALLVACRGTTEPVPTPGYPIVGYYRLVTINGQSLPAPLGNSQVQGGGLTIAEDSGWTVGDTSSSSGFGTTFSWGGIVRRDSLNAYSLTDSAKVGVRYTASFDSVVFTLKGSSGYTYRYQRTP